MTVTNKITMGGLNSKRKHVFISKVYSSRSTSFHAGFASLEFNHLVYSLIICSHFENFFVSFLVIFSTMIKNYEKLFRKYVSKNQISVLLKESCASIELPRVRTTFVDFRVLSTIFVFFSAISFNKIQFALFLKLV